jgi:hypothetical protein
MSDVRRWMAWSEERLAILMIQEGLAVGLAQAIQGPMTVTFRVRLLQPSKASLAKLLSLGPAIGQALQTSQARISDSARGILIEIPSPQPRTPGAELLASHSKGLSIAIGLNSFREPVLMDFQRWPHLLAVGPTRRGKSQALRSILYALLKANSLETLRFLILAKKREDWQSFQPATGSYGLLIEPEEQERALAWLVKLLEERAATGRKKPAIFLIADDLRNIAARASLTGQLGEIASMGGAAGIHLILSSQTTGKAGGLSQDLEQNLVARLIYGSADAAAGARYAGSGGFQVETVGIAPGDALLILDGQPERVATGLCAETAIAQLQAGELAKPWNKREQPEQREQASQASSPSAIAGNASQGGGAKQEPEQASQNSLRLDASRPPTQAERALIRQLYQETRSKRQTILRAYGHYNGKVFEYVTGAISEAPGSLQSQQTGLQAYQYDSNTAERSEASGEARRASLEPSLAGIQEIDLTTEAGQQLLAQLGQAGLLQWSSDSAKVIQ